MADASSTTLSGILKQSFDATLAWEHPSPERLKLNACLFFAAFLCSLGVGLSSSLKARGGLGVCVGDIYIVV